MSKTQSKRPGKEGGKRQQNRQRRIREIGAAALGLFLERGIVGVTIDEIVGAAGIAKASFYRYFRDKEHLVSTLLEPLSVGALGALNRAAEELKSATDTGAFFEAYNRLGEDLAMVILSNSGLVQLYLQEARAPGVRARAPVGALAQLIDDGAFAVTAAAHTHGLLKPFHPRVSTLAVVGASERLLLAVLRREDVGDIATLPLQLVSLILDGVRAEGGPPQKSGAT
jgi:AcrR family transcriptional regulator